MPLDKNYKKAFQIQGILYISNHYVYLTLFCNTDMLNTQASSAKKLTKDQLTVRINGTLPDISTLGTAEKSEKRQQK